jgi:hypothetical protein
MMIDHRVVGTKDSTLHPLEGSEGSWLREEVVSVRPFLSFVHYR